LPSSSHDLDLSRPSTAIRLPLQRYSAHSSAWRSQTETVRKSAPPSRLARSTASTKVATFFSGPTSRSWTSVARLPISVTTFTFASSSLLPKLDGKL